METNANCPRAKHALPGGLKSTNGPASHGDRLGRVSHQIATPLHAIHARYYSASGSTPNGPSSHSMVGEYGNGSAKAASGIWNQSRVTWSVPASV